MIETIEIQVAKEIDNKFICDKCGEDCTALSINPSPRSPNALKGVHFDLYGGYDSDFDLLYDDFQLCNDCTREFYEWIGKEPYFRTKVI